MSLKNVMPEKMQNGGGLPFARQRTDPGPRFSTLPAFVPPSTNNIGPTIGLPEQQPIDDLNRFQPIEQPLLSDPEKKANEIQTNIDPQSDLYSLYNQQNQQAAFETARQSLPGLTNVSWANMTQQQKQPYLDRAERLSFSENIGANIFGFLAGAVSRGALTGLGKKAKESMLKTNQKELEEARQKGIMVPSGPTQTTVQQVMPYSSYLSQLRSSGQLSPSEYVKNVEEYKTGLANQSYGQRSMISPTLTTPMSFPSQYQQASSTLSPMQQFRAADQASMETFDTVETFESPGKGTIGYALGYYFDEKGRYGITKDNQGFDSFSSFQHGRQGITMDDEISLIDTGISNGAFNNVNEGKQTIDAFVANGHSQDVVEAVAKNEITVEEVNQLGAAVGVKESVDPGVDAPKVICAELYRQGLLEKEIFELDEEFGRHLRKVDPDIINGYHRWALPLVSLMQRSITVSNIIKIIAKPVVKHIAYQMGYPSKTYLGAAMFTVGKHICRFIAKKDVAHA